MRRVLLVLGAAITALATMLALATPAQAASWFDLNPGTSTFFISNGNTNVAKVVVGVQGFGAGTISSVSAVRARCSVRNLNFTFNGGDRVDDCALGIFGGATLTGCETGGCPALDGGSCCANAFSTLRFASPSGNLSFRARITFSWRDKTTGNLVGPGNILSDGTTNSYRLT